MNSITANAMPLPAGVLPMAPGAYGAPMGQGLMTLPAAPGAPAAGPVIVTPGMGVPQGVPGMGVQGVPGPMPQGMVPNDPSAQAMLGAEATKPPSTVGSIIKSALVFGGLGAALGAGATFLPIIPGGPLTGALIGGVAGALLGAVRGFRSARRAQEEYKMMMQGAPGAPADPNSLGPQVPVHVGDATGAKKKKRTAAKAGGATVKVRKGDTLGAIAKRHHVTVKELHAANRKAIGPNPSKLKVGTKLIIPK